MFQTEGIKHAYRQGVLMSFPDIKLEKGSEGLIIGPSGCGKTTLLHVMAGFLKPKEGNVRLNEQNLYALSESQRDKFRAKQIGFVFQKNLFVNSLSIGENLKLAMQFAGQKIEKKQILSFLELLSIESKYDKLPHELSVGERQRASIARALLNKPSVLLADEPTSALDDDNAKVVLELLKKSSREFDTALLVVTHDNRVKSDFSTIYELKRPS